MKKIVADYEEALKLAPKEASIYLELARVAAENKPPDLEEATRILKAGLEADPKNVSLYLMLATVEEYRAGNTEAAERVLLQGVEQIPDSLEIRAVLADKLARRGATAALQEQIVEMSRIGIAPQYIDYYKAFYAVNMKDWAAARKILVEKLQPFDLSTELGLRASVNDLLSRCYAHLGDPERQRAALASSVRDNPNNIQAKLRWIADLAAQNEVDQAINEYRKLLGQVPLVVRLPLAKQLMIRNQRLPASRRDWKEIEDLIALAVKDAPEAPQPVLAKAQVLKAQGKAAEAKSVLEAAVARDPNDPGVASLWAALAEMQPDYQAALKVLDDARAKLGDQFELRTRAREDPGGPRRARRGCGPRRPDRGSRRPAQGAASRGVGGGRQRIGAEEGSGRRGPTHGPSGLVDPQRPPAPAFAAQLGTPGGRQGGHRTGYRRNQVGSKVPTATAPVTPRSSTRSGSRGSTRTRPSRRGCEARRGLCWPNSSSRRPDWSVIPLATAKLDEEELKLATDANDKKQRQSRLADLYRQAIDMGQRNLAVVRRATEMLIASGRTAEVTQLWNKVPVLSGDGELSVLERTVLDKVIRDKDYENALEIVRQRVAARPGDFAERILFVQLLLAEKRPGEAEAELNKAVAQDRSDPNRWIAPDSVPRREQANRQGRTGCKGP